MDRRAPRRLVLVAGAGVSGLVAARALAARNDVVLAEADGACGGKMRTAEFRGCPLDLGPDVFITRNPAAERLCRELGLGDELIAPSTARAAIWARGTLRPFPPGLALGIPIDLVALLRSGVVSPAAIARAATDLVPRGRVTPAGFADATSPDVDLSVGTVVGRRLGREVVETLVDPLLGGINAGDVRQLSFAATAPELAAAIAGRWSVLLALRSYLRKGKKPQTRTSPIFLGLGRGLEALARRLEKDCGERGVEIRTSTAVGSIRRNAAGRGWRVDLGQTELACDGVVLAAPSHVSAKIVAAEAPELAALLATIPYAGVVTVSFAWPATVLADSTRSLVGSGVLVPRRDGLLATALSLTSSKWPRSARPDEIVVRASAGHHGDGRALALDDEALVGRLRSEIATILGIGATPLDALVQRWPESFPQYVVGHRARVARIESLAADLGPIALAGAWAHGIGIPACIVQAERAAAALGAALG
ncbi:MAG TPA: protoporphyrinogen oxidase [Acidimicrobiales bacterium]|nr:protoporphyrinogen oxidase [Acidimicrobiales bacterium]